MVKSHVASDIITTPDGSALDRQDRDHSSCTSNVEKTRNKMTSDKTILQGCVRDLQGTLGMTHIIQDEIKRLRDENERLRAEIADLRARLAAEAGGEVDGWKWAETRGEYYWTWQGCASEWCVRVFSNRAGWWWQIEGPGDIINTDAYMRQDVLDAMRAAVAAYERLRGEEDGGDA